MGVRARRVVVCVAGVVMACAAGCTSGQKGAPSEKVADVGAQERAKVAAGRVAWVDALAERVAQRRDRAWKKPPGFVARDVAQLDPPPPVWSPEVAEEAALLGEALLGVKEVPGAAPRARLAYVDEATGDVVYAAKAPRDALAPALAAALNGALLRQYYTAVPTPTTWDGWLTAQLVRDGEAAVAGVLESLGTTAEVVADRPDLLERSVDVRSWALATKGGVGSSAHAFTHRVGFAFVTSLFRSQGWNGVEMMRMSGPEATTSAARHGEWMNGQGAPRWTWPGTLDEGMERQGLKATRKGSAGAATIAAIVEANGAPPAALSLSMAMRADYYVAYEKEGERVVVWASLGGTPSLAAQAKGQIEARLEAVSAPHRRVRVWRDGLKLVVGVALGAPAAPLELAERGLVANVAFPARDGFALPYASSSTELALLGRELGHYDEATKRWSEPTLGAKMDLGALGEGWKVDLNSRGLLRWFARRDTELVQMSVELRDPLAGGPAFDAPEYATQFGQAMEKAIAGAKANVERKTYPFGKVIEVGVDGDAERMRVAHFARGTILFTYSVRGPSEGFDALWKGAQSALSTLEGVSDAASGSSEGTIEYTIED